MSPTHIDDPVEGLTDSICGININKHQPPHIPDHEARASYVPPSTQNTQEMNLDSTQNYGSRGQMMYWERRIQENLCLNGKSKLLRQFLLDIYDILDQYLQELSSDEQIINCITSHFSSLLTTVSPSQAWFSSLLMINAYKHGVVDQYATLKCLDYVIQPLLSTNNFINESILVVGDKTSSKTERDKVEKCKEGKTLITDYSSFFYSLSFHVQQSPEDVILKYVAGLHPDVRREVTWCDGWGSERTCNDLCPGFHSDDITVMYFRV